MTRRIAVLLVALSGLVPFGPLASGAPAGAALPVPTFTTVAGAAGPDASRGDGVCATAGGGCSLQAAFDEAIALRRGNIVVTTADSGVTAAVRGTITVTGTDQYLDALALTVERGATLTMRRLRLAGGPTTVRGRLNLDRVTLLDPARFWVESIGTATLTNTLAFLDGAPLTNKGRLRLVFTTVRRAYDPADAAKAIQTGTGATTTLLASNLMASRGNGRACGGAKPVSQGYNLAFDDTCGLTHPTDLGAYRPSATELGPAGTVRLDAVPAGEAGCGTTVTTDLGGGPRPADGDGDGTAACDIGYAEAAAPAA